MNRTNTITSPSLAFTQLSEYLTIHFSPLDFTTVCPDELAADLFRQYYIFLGDDATSWYKQFQSHYLHYAHMAGLNYKQAEYVLRGGTFAKNVQKVLTSVTA